MELDAATLISLIGGLGGLGTGLGALIISWRKARSETRKVESEAHSIDVQSLCDTVEALDNEVKRLRLVLEEERVQTATTIHKLRSDLDGMEIRLATAQEQMIEDAKAIQRLEAENIRLREALERALEGSRALQSQLTQFKMDLDKATARIRHLEGENKTLRQALDEAQAAYSNNKP